MDEIGAAVECRRPSEKRSSGAAPTQSTPMEVAWAVREDSGPIQGKEGVCTGCLFLREVLIMRPRRSRLE
jgi:hypothetical protein